MTETGPTVFIPDEATARAKPGSVGKPVGTMLTRVVDARGRDCAANERGELLVKGPGVTPGYWNKPGETARAFVGDWYRTGDLGRRAEGDGRPPHALSPFGLQRRAAMH